MCVCCQYLWGYKCRGLVDSKEEGLCETGSDSVCWFEYFPLLLQKPSCYSNKFRYERGCCCRVCALSRNVGELKQKFIVCISRSILLTFFVFYYCSSLWYTGNLGHLTFFGLFSLHLTPVTVLIFYPFSLQWANLHESFGNCFVLNVLPDTT